MSVSAIAAGLLVLAVLTALGYLFRARLQFCPHCAWIVPQVRHGWLRCPRCHKQYARRQRLRSH